ncbi:hypothetical protein SELMODRAFT_404263 [Selaginella moellendorffii]|uniref:Uncharacterized protein n=1 Tax=Selaginella moellendorffii TaxID=88036 RepID=D8QUS9_SELML|nr:hypothetical protein SELMODRAFT_404263 [Selaginella moellendorffii]
MDAQIDLDANVIEAIGTSVPKVAATGGRVLVSNVGSGGETMHLATEATCGKFVQNHWVHSSYNLNMAIYSSFAEVGFGSTVGLTSLHFKLIHWFMTLSTFDLSVFEAIQVKLTARKGQELYIRYQLPLDFLVAVWVKELVKHKRNSFTTFLRVMSFAEQSICLELLNTWL